MQFKKKRPYVKNGKLVLGGKKTLFFLKNKLILRSGTKQRGGLLPILKAILSSLNLIAGKRKTKKGRKKQYHS